MRSMTYLHTCHRVPEYRILPINAGIITDCGTGRGLLCLTVGRAARFTVPDSGAQGEVYYSTHLLNLKSITLNLTSSI